MLSLTRRLLPVGSFTEGMQYSFVWGLPVDSAVRKLEQKHGRDFCSMGGTFQATARVQGSDIFQKAVKMTEMHSECEFWAFRIQTLTWSHPCFPEWSDSVTVMTAVWVSCQVAMSVCLLHLNPITYARCAAESVHHHSRVLRTDHHFCYPS